MPLRDFAIKHLSTELDLPGILPVPPEAAGDDVWVELAPLRQRIGATFEPLHTAAAANETLDALYEHSLAVVDELLPRLFHIRLPISARTRRAVKAMHEILELQARFYSLAMRPTDGLPHPNPRIAPDVASLRVLSLLQRHLFISNLISSSPAPGLWRQLHTAAGFGRRTRMWQLRPRESPHSMEEIYARALLLGCAPASFFTAHEWSCIGQYFDDHAKLVQLSEDRPLTGAQSIFWFDPTQDMPPVNAARRPPSDGASIVHFAGDALLARITQDRQHLRNGTLPPPRGFPNDLPARLARPLLHRLGSALGEPRRRRFPRRRQGYRALLCIGFDCVWELLRGKGADFSDQSEWLVTNESPDGYAAMHIARRAQKVQIGDLVALRSAASNGWQICIVRRALSENPEHLELGLQILAPRGTPALMSLSGPATASLHRIVLLPAVPPLHDRQSIATPPGLLTGKPGESVVVTDDGTADARTVRILGIDEQSANIDVFSMEPEPPGRTDR